MFEVNKENTHVANVTAKPNVPGTDLELMQSAKFAQSEWQKSNEISLVWSSAEQLDTKITNYENLVDQKAETITLRKIRVGEMKALNTDIDIGVERLKTKLIGIYGRTEAIVYYHQIGLDNSTNSYSLPVAYFKRSKAIEKLIKALPNLGLSENDYGLLYWQETYAKLVALSDELAEIAGSISVLSAEKNEAKAEIKQTLYSLYYSLKANYPSNFRAMARKYGLLKERF